MVNRYLQLLGPVSVHELGKTQSNSSVIPRFRSQRTVAILGFLAAERRPIARDHLAAMIWPDEVSSKARGNLRRELHNLSQILPESWHLERNAVAFAPCSNLIVDTHKLLELEADERWHEAVELLSGEYLEGLHLDDNLEYENWLLGERERWRGRSEAVLTRVIDSYTRRGQYDEALIYSQRLLQITPWNEAAHRQVMQLLTWIGQRGAALRQYAICKQVLWEELRVEPSAETVALYQQIRVGKLDIPPQLPAFLTGEEARHPVDQGVFVARELELAQLNSFLDTTLAGQGQVMLIAGGPGRGKTALMNAFALQAMEKYPDLLVVNGNCYTYSGVGDPYLPFRDVLAMLTGDLESRWDTGAISRDHALRLWVALPLVLKALLEQSPHLLGTLVYGTDLLTRANAALQANDPSLSQLREQVKRSMSVSSELDQSHIFEQVTNLLLTLALTQPLILVLDDLQWADNASISLLFHLGRRLAEVDSKILIICAYRPEEVAVDRAGLRHPLAKPLNEFKRSFGDMWIDLGQTERSNDREFVDALLDTEPNRLNDDFRAALHQRTQGHPLFTVELLRAMRERGDLFINDLGYLVEGPNLDWELLPARVEAVIEERIDRLDQESQEMLAVASVEGEVFTAQVVAEVQNIPERFSLQKFSQEFERQHRLVSEEGEVHTRLRRLSRYRFVHVVFQDYLYNRLSLGERRLLHAEVAEALEKLYTGQLDDTAVRIAHHFLKAEDYENAFLYFNKAGEHATRMYANDEAIRNYTRSAELIDKVSPDPITLAELHRRRGLAHGTLGEYEQARADLDTCLQIAQSIGDNQMEWRALIDLGKLSASRDYNRTKSYFEQALNLSRRMGEPTELAISLNRMGNWLANDEKPLQAVSYHQEALTIFEQLDNSRDIANTLDLLGIAHLLAGDYNTSVKYYDRAIPIFKDLDDRPRLVSSLIGRGVIVSLVCLLAMVPPDPAPHAHQDFREAVEIAREIGSSPDEAWASWALGLLFTLEGKFGEALEAIQKGTAIATDIGHREWLVGNLFALGVLYCEMLAPEKALIELQRALDLAEELRSQYWINHVTGAQATAYLLLGDLSRAQDSLDTVLTNQTPMDTKGRRYCWARRAELFLLAGDPGTALSLTDRLIDTASGMTPDKVITFLWKLKGDALQMLDQYGEAEDYLTAALANAQKNEERFLQWRIHSSLSRLYQLTQRSEKAQTELTAGRSQIAQLAATIRDKDLKHNFSQRALKYI